MRNISSIPEKRIAMRVTTAAERAIRKGHPWIYESAITDQSHEGKAGDLAVIFDKKRKFLAIGLYEPNSTIRVRILQRLKPATIGEKFFKAKLDTANQLRASLRDTPPERLTNGYRLVHGENDGLPGLIIDRYADIYVIKLYTSAWFPHLKDVLAALDSIVHVEQIVLRLGGSAKENDFKLEDGMLLKGDVFKSAVFFRENGFSFEVDPIHGQKTGFFLDQRENRTRVEKLAMGKRVLNVFSYTGGFSVYAASGGATEVLSLDASKPATDAAERNFKLNFPNSNIHKTITGDAFIEMARMKAKGQRFEMVVIDPPSFAKKASQTEGAINAYQKLTKLGLDILAPNGILVQASCSSRVKSEAFFDAIHATAHQHGRPLNEIKRTSHALDHPIGFREGEYLKCLYATTP